MSPKISDGVNWLKIKKSGKFVIFYMEGVSPEKLDIQEFTDFFIQFVICYKTMLDPIGERTISLVINEKNLYQILCRSTCKGSLTRKKLRACIMGGYIELSIDGAFISLDIDNSFKVLSLCILHLVKFRSTQKKRDSIIRAELYGLFSVCY